MPNKRSTRRVRVRAIRRDRPDIKKLSRALIELALAQARAEAEAQAEHEQRQAKQHGEEPRRAA